MSQPFAGLFTGGSGGSPAPSPAPQSAKPFAGLFTAPTPAPAAVKATPIAPITPVAPTSQPAAPIAPINAGSTPSGASAPIAIPKTGPIPAAPIGEPESITEKAGADMEKYAPALTQTLADLQTNPANLGNSLKSIVETPFTDVKSARDAFNSTVANFITGIKNKAPASEDVSNGLQAATTLVGGALTPITTWFNVANKIPVVGDISKLLFNVPFSALGDASGDAGVGALKALPISDEAKANLEPGIRAVSTLAGQIIAGKYVAPDVMDMLNKHFGPEDAQTIVSKAQEVAQEAKDNPNSPATKAVPDATAKPNPDAAPTSKATEPITDPTKPGAELTETPPPNKTSGIAKSIEANAIAKGLTDKFENLAGFEGKNVKDQAAKVADFITNNEAAARDAVQSQKLPDGMSPTMFLKGMEDFAMKNGDADLLQKLASSPITAESSVHAQELRFAGERDPDSPVDKIKDVQSSREKNVQAKNGGKSVDVLRDKVKADATGEIKKASARPRDWGSFISSIEC